MTGSIWSDFSKSRVSSGGDCPCGKQEEDSHPIGWCHEEDAKRYMWVSATMQDGNPVGDVTVDYTNPKAVDSAHKIPLYHCPPSAIIAIASVIAQGHKKPGRDIYNWREKPISLMHYYSAVQRHLAKFFDGEDLDEELTELAGFPISHWDAAMSGMAIVKDAEQCGTLIDDRPMKGGAAKYLDRITKKP